ncbi:MAG: alpha-amylase family glycosyl hydrolase, partial [Gemmatimonadaceae bacterium]
SFTVGEMTDESPGVMETYYPDQLDSYFAFAVAKGAMHAAETGNAREFVGAVAHANENFPTERWSPFLTNHDQPRVMTVLGDEPKARVAASAVLMLPGMPFIYYGEEIGMVGDKPDERIRTPMQWSAGANGGFTSGTPWEELQADWRTKNVAGQDSSSASLLNHYRRLIQMRNAEPALNRGKLRLLDTTDPSIVAWLRYLADERFMIVVNFGSLDSEVDVAHAPLPRGDYRLEPVYADPVDACAGYTYLNESGSLLVKKVKAHGFCALRIRSP